MIRPITLVVQFSTRNGANSARSFRPLMARPQNPCRKKSGPSEMNDLRLLENGGEPFPK